MGRLHHEPITLFPEPHDLTRLGTLKRQRIPRVAHLSRRAHVDVSPAWSSGLIVVFVSAKISAIPHPRVLGPSRLVGMSNLTTLSSKTSHRKDYARAPPASSAFIKYGTKDLPRSQKLLLARLLLDYGGSLQGLVPIRLF